MIRTARNDMSVTPLSRFAAPIAIVAGVLVVATRLVILLTTPTELAQLKTYVLGPTHAINSVASVLAFALLVIVIVAAYHQEARAAGGLGALAVSAAIVGTVFMAGDWWYEAFAVPRMAEVAPLAMDTFVGGRLLAGGIASFLLFGIGWALFAVASLRADVYPAGISVAILVGGILSGVPIGIVYLSGGVILGLAVVALGASRHAHTTIATATEPSATGQTPTSIGASAPATADHARPLLDGAGVSEK